MSFFVGFCRKVFFLWFASAIATATLADSNMEITFWNSVRESGDPAKIKLYLNKYPNGSFAELAEMLVEEIDGYNSEINVDRESDELAQETCDYYTAHAFDYGYDVQPTSWDRLKENAATAVQSCEFAKETSNPRMIFQLGRALLAAEDFGAAIEHYETAASMGHVVSIYFLSNWRREGKNGLSVNQSKALSGYERVVAQPKESNGVAGYSAFWLGWLLTNGAENVTQDFHLARRYFDMAVKLGDPRGHYGLRYLHYNIDSLLDHELAVFHLEKSVEKTTFFNENALEWLSKLLLQPALWAIDSQEFWAQQDQAKRALDTLRARRENSVESFNDYMSAVGALYLKSLTILANEKETRANTQKKVLHKELRSWSEKLLSQFLLAASIRKSTFAGKFPDTLEQLQDFGSLSSRYVSAVEEIGAYNVFLNEMRLRNSDTPGSSNLAFQCTNGDGESIQRKGVWVFKGENHCNYPILMSLSVDFVEQNGAVRSLKRQVTVGGHESVALNFSVLKHEAEVRYCWAACFDEFGFGEIEEGDGRGYSCKSASLNSHHPYIRSHYLALVEKLEEIVGLS